MAEGPDGEARIPDLGLTPRRGGEKPGKAPVEEEEKGPIGIFPSWGWVYGTVLVYGACTILILWLLTRFLDPGVGP